MHETYLRLHEITDARFHSNYPENHKTVKRLKQFKLDTILYVFIIIGSIALASGYLYEILVY